MAGVLKKKHAVNLAEIHQVAQMNGIITEAIFHSVVLVAFHRVF
jgi:hypothetical protein